jgi:membrane-associated protease RseP (regulator of RpoE activity)
MRNRTFVFLMGMTLVAIGIVVLPWTLRSQGRAMAPPAPQAACDASAESLKALFASHGWKLSREMQSRLRELQNELAAEEAEMTSQLPNADDLRASLEGAQAELAAAKAQEVESHLQSLLGQEPGTYLVEEGSGYLGIEISEVSADKAKELKLPAVRGVLITEVESDSPAAKAGLQAGDVITNFDRQEVEGTVQFRRLVHETPPGRSTPLVVMRNGAAQNLSIEVGDRLAKMEMQVQRLPRVFNMPDFNFEMPEVFGGMTPMLGINAEDLNGQLGDYFGVPGGEGVLVREVHSDTPAEKAGLKAGDVITQVDGAPVKTVGDLREQLQAKHEQKTISLSVLRKGASMTVNVAIEPPRHHEHTHITRRVAT